MLFIQKLVNSKLSKDNHIIILWNVLQVIGFRNSSGVFAYQSTRAYFKVRANLY